MVSGNNSLGNGHASGQSGQSGQVRSFLKLRQTPLDTLSKQERFAQVSLSSSVCFSHSTLNEFSSSLSRHITELRHSTSPPMNLTATSRHIDSTASSSSTTDTIALNSRLETLFIQMVAGELEPVKELVSWAKERKDRAFTMLEKAALIHDQDQQLREYSLKEAELTLEQTAQFSEVKNRCDLVSLRAVEGLANVIVQGNANVSIIAQRALLQVAHYGCDSVVISVIENACRAALITPPGENASVRKTQVFAFLIELANYTRPEVRPKIHLYFMSELQEMLTHEESVNRENTIRIMINFLYQNSSSMVTENVIDVLERVIGRDRSQNVRNALKKVSGELDIQFEIAPFLKQIVDQLLSTPLASRNDQFDTSDDVSQSDGLPCTIS